MLRICSPKKSPEKRPFFGQNGISMPVEFINEIQKNRYGKFPAILSSEELAQYFHFDDADLTLINKRRGDHNRLGFALQLGTVRYLGNFISNPIELSLEILNFVILQLKMENLDCLSLYMKRNQTRYDHIIEIKNVYHYHDFNEYPWRFRLSRVLYISAWIDNDRASIMFDIATAWLIKNKILLPGVTTLERLISQIRDRTSKKLWRSLSTLPSNEQIKSLNKLLVIHDDKYISTLEYLRQGPVHISGPSLKKALNRYQDIQNIGIHTLDVSSIPLIRLQNLARHAAQLSAYKIERMPDDKRVATLVAFAYSYEIIALDEALDVLDLFIANITGKAKIIGKQNRIRTLKDLD